ncbi:MAG: DUF3667 domain-containing protein [Sphingomonas bacterium]|nr:DUF3667 domain-containing protein [Sphingomonas bacterium]
MDEIEAIGDAVSGGLVARAIEPSAGAVAPDGHTQEAACLNCATPLSGDYCHACGQHAHVHRTLSAFIHDFLHGVFHLEGKIWRTLPVLAWQPGRLTRDYIEGQRARFVSPIALFLFSVFLMFAAISALGSPAALTTDSVRNDVSTGASKSEAQVKKLEAARAKIVAARGNSEAIDRQLAAAREEASLLKTIAERGLLKGSAVRVSDDVPAWLAAPLRRAAADPEFLLYKVQNNAYKYSWALIPISLPFMWLLFPFSRRFRLYDHMVFVTYSLAFMTLLVVTASLLHAAGLGVLAGFALMLPPFHMYRQLRGAYGLTRLGALWRTLLLLLCSIVVAGLFVVSLFALGLF